MSSNVIRWFLSCSVFVVVVGCESVTQTARQQGAAPHVSFTAADRPVFTVAYYPYGVCMPRHLAAPVPNYNNWTPSRMARDLRRFQNTGFDEVLICVGTEIANDQYGLRRAVQFIEEAQRFGGMKVTFFINSGKVPLRRDVFAERLLSARVHASPAVLQEAGRLVVFVADDVELMGTSHPAILFRKVKANDWFWATSGRVVDDVLIREDGRLLQRNIWQAYRDRASRIVLSWNNFDSGDFVEPNSHDSETDIAMLIVRTEIRRVTDAVQRNQPAPAALPDATPAPGLRLE